MANLANVLKSEIARLAAKEVRAETQRLKKLSGHYRSDIAALKRRVLALEQQLKRLARQSGRSAPAAASEEDAGPDAGGIKRFSASGLAAQRRRLGLSLNAFGLLLGVSGQSVRLWEEGKTYPRRSHFPAIAAVRKMGKKDAAARLESLAAEA